MPQSRERFIGSHDQVYRQILGSGSERMRDRLLIIPFSAKQFGGASMQLHETIWRPEA